PIPQRTACNLFRYTTLFRSGSERVLAIANFALGLVIPADAGSERKDCFGATPKPAMRLRPVQITAVTRDPCAPQKSPCFTNARRSEEHTSVLQSRVALVCRH